MFTSRRHKLTFLCLHVSYMSLPLSFIANELAFDSVSQAKDFLMEHRSGFFKNPNNPDEEKILDCKPTIQALQQIFDEKYRKIQIKGAV